MQGVNSALEIVGKTKKRTKCKTPKPRRMSTRNRKQTEKGKYYNEHLNECNDTGIDDDATERSSAKIQEGPQDLVSPVSSSGVGRDLLASTGNDLGPNDLSTPLVPSTAEKCFITPRIARERSKSEPGRPLNLRLEIEEATSPSQPSPLVTNVPHVLPKSVMVVDSRFVGEIHFQLDEGDDTAPVHDEVDDTAPVHDENLAFLSDIYELYYGYGYGAVPDDEEDMEGGGVEVGVGVKVRAEVGKANVKSLKSRKLVAFKQKVEELQQLLLVEQLKNKKISHEFDVLHKELFQRAQKQKILEDENGQLRNGNSYRIEVERLQDIIHGLEREKFDCIENLKKQEGEMDMMRSSLSDFITENTVLKNAAKQKRQEFASSDTQTEYPERQELVSCDTQTEFSKEITFSDISALTECVEVVNVQVGCLKCTSDKKLIDELLASLDAIEKSVAYKQSLKYDQNITELLGRVDTIEKSMSFTSNMEQKTATNDCTSDSGLKRNSSISRTTHPSGNAYIPSIKDTLLSQMNTYHPLQHVNNNTQYIPYKPKQTDDAQSLPIKPGHKLYSETVKDSLTTMIVTDSMSGGVKANCIKKNIKGKDEKIIFKRFPGHTAEDIAYYVPKPLCDKKPDHVIIIAGTNDLTRAMYEKDSVDEFEVVENIMKIGRAAQENGAKKIFVSSVMTRRGYRYQEVVKKVNDVLYMACVAENFSFMDQADITMSHISSDGIHLNSHGTVILLFNILSVFSNFDSKLIDFNKDYEHAKSLC